MKQNFNDFYITIGFATIYGVSTSVEELITYIIVNLI